MFDLNSATSRLLFDTLLKGQRDNIQEAVMSTVEIVQSFDARFMALEAKIDAILDHIGNADARADLLDVLKEIKEGADVGDAVAITETDGEPDGE